VATIPKSWPKQYGGQPSPALAERPGRIPIAISAEVGPAIHGTGKKHNRRSTKALGPINLANVVLPEPQGHMRRSSPGCYPPAIFGRIVALANALSRVLRHEALPKESTASIR